MFLLAYILIRLMQHLRMVRKFGIQTVVIIHLFMQKVKI